MVERIELCTGWPNQICLSLVHLFVANMARYIYTIDGSGRVWVEATHVARDTALGHSKRLANGEGQRDGSSAS